MIDLDPEVEDFQEIVKAGRFELRDDWQQRYRVYVAGPYSSNPVGCTRDAVHVAEALWDAGYAPYVPHLTMLWDLISPHECTSLDDQPFYLELDFQWLADCDVVVRLPGQSIGADREVALAKKLGIPVFEWRAGVTDELERHFASCVDGGPGDSDDEEFGLLVEIADVLAPHLVEKHRLVSQVAEQEKDLDECRETLCTATGEVLKLRDRIDGLRHSVDVWERIAKDYSRVAADRGKRLDAVVAKLEEMARAVGVAAGQPATEYEFADDDDADDEGAA
jgi:hypothetical protein